MSRHSIEPRFAVPSRHQNPASGDSATNFIFLTAFRYGKLFRFVVPPSLFKFDDEVHALVTLPLLQDTHIIP